MKFEEWSEQRKTEWKHLESYYSTRGVVQKLANGEWLGKVSKGEKLYRLTEVYVSAEAAMMAVERTWEREHKKG